MTDILTETYYHWLPNHLLVTVGDGLRSASTTHSNAQLCAINIDSLRALCLQAGREWIVRVGILDTSNHATYSTAQGYASLDICSTTIIVSLTRVGLFAQPDHLAPRREPNITILGGVGTNDEAIAKHLSLGRRKAEIGTSPTEYHSDGGCFGYDVELGRKVFCKSSSAIFFYSSNLCNVKLTYISSCICNATALY